MRLLDASGKDVVIVETVGVGQTELGVMGVADTVVVTLMPEAGDIIQTLKAGLMEIADIYVVNKADREGANQMVVAITSMLKMASAHGDWIPPVPGDPGQQEWRACPSSMGIFSVTGTFSNRTPGWNSDAGHGGAKSSL